MSDIKPLVVVFDDKFDGVYSGGKWTAWNLCYVPSKIFGDAKECADFFSKDTIVYGRGETPQEAIDDLKMILDCGISDPDEKDDDEEDEDMEPTSVWEFENLDNIGITLDDNEISLLLRSKDGLTKIILTGDAAKYYNDNFDIVLKTDNEEKIKKLEQADMLDKEAADYWSKEYDTLSERFAKLQEENKKLKDKVEHVEPFRALERTIREKQELKKELSLERAANEAYHRFFYKYAGKVLELTALKTPTIENFTDEKPSTRADILDQAKKCVCGQREQDYGTPESNFQLIADLWNGYLGEKTDNPVISVTPVDVSMMMALMKIARIRNGGGSGDSFVDLAGYAACGGEIWHMQNHRDQN